MAMAMIIISYATIFSDLGLSTAFIQRQLVTQEERSSLYWLSVIVGGGVMLLAIAAAPLAAYLLEAPELPALIAIISTNFLASAFSQSLRANAEKNLNFKPLALIEVVSTACGLAVAILAAWQGWGVYSLAVAAMAGTWLNTLLCWTFLADGWRPLWRLRWAEVSWFVHFGAGMVMTNLINHVNSTVDLLLGGRLLGVAQLGLYSVPRNLVLQVQSVVNPVFTRVGFPVIASIQHDQTRVQQVYLQVMNLTATVNAPIYVVMAVFAPELVSLLLGQHFRDSAPLLQWLALWGLLRSFANPAGALVFGMGRVRLATLWNLALLCVVPPALWVGAQFGAEGMASALAGVTALLFVPGWAFLVRPTSGLRLWPYAQQVLVPTFCALLAGVAAWLAAGPFSAPWSRLAVGLASGALGYVVFTWLLNRQFADLVKHLTSRHDAPTSEHDGVSR